MARFKCNFTGSNYPVYWQEYSNLLRKVVPMLLSLGIVGNSSAADCQFQINNEWNSGYTASVNITNNTGDTISGWLVQLNFIGGSNISSAWNANLSGNNPYSAEHKNYNGNISPGASTSFGFNVNKAVNGSPAEIPELGGICVAGASPGAPIAEFTTSSQLGEVPFNVHFDANQSQAEAGAELTFQWEFGDGNSGTGMAPNHTYTEPGDYVVSLMVNDGQHDSAITRQTITALPPEPDDAICEYRITDDWLAGFTAYVSIHNDAAYAINGWNITLSYSDATAITGTWNSQLSGNNPYQISNANHNSQIAPGASVEFGFNAQKATPGSVPSIPSLGGMCRGSETVNLAPTAVASASVLQGDAPLAVNFDASQSSDPEAEALSYQWQFADLGSSNEINPNFTFSQAGSYVVDLVVNDGVQDSNTASLTIEVSETSVVQGYELDASQSSLFFVSSKKLHVLETHHFDLMAGEISSDGDASLRLGLDSVATGIDIRNQRMREHLFDTANFAQAEILASVDLAQLYAMALGDVAEIELTALLNLHGFTQPIQTTVRVTKLENQSLLVQNTHPIMLLADDYGLSEGVETLRQLAGLDVISHSVPVNFTLLFNPQY